MKDLLGAHLTPMLVECCPLDNLRLQCVLCQWYQFPSKRFYDGCRVDAMR
jgi:hypothetical protein